MFAPVLFLPLLSFLLSGNLRLGKFQKLKLFLHRTVSGQIQGMAKHCKSDGRKLPWNTNPSTQSIPTDNFHSTAGAEAPSPHSMKAQLEALQRDPIEFDRPQYPSYAILAERIRSYSDWPAEMTQTPRDMALAGFFYPGYGDYTRILFAEGGLRDWEAEDDPWVSYRVGGTECEKKRKDEG